MGSRGETYRRGVINGSDPLHRHSLNQETTREMAEGDKRFYPQDKGAKARRRKNGGEQWVIIPEKNVFSTEETPKDISDAA